MRISKKTQYGLRAMIFLASKKNEICSLREIAKKEKIPLHFLEKIFSNLEKSNLVKAKKGFRGGYFLAKEPKKIKIGQIIDTLESEMAVVKCLKHFCPRERKCPAKKFWQKLNKSLISAFNSVSLEDLLK